MKCHCQSCGTHYDDYEVWDDVWQAGGWDDAVLGTTAYMCVRCLEIDIGRPVTAMDFTGSPLNGAYLRECDHCGSLFRFMAPSQWYCSVECGKAEDWVVKKECRNCQTRFAPKRKNQAFCSTGCFSASRSKDISVRVCENCGSKFGTYHPTRKFCSLRCVGESQRVKHDEILCACGCGESFTPKRRDQRFASRACATRYARAQRVGFKIENPDLRDFLPGSGEIII